MFVKTLNAVETIRDFSQHFAISSKHIVLFLERNVNPDLSLSLLNSNCITGFSHVVFYSLQTAGEDC